MDEFWQIDLFGGLFAHHRHARITKFRTQTAAALLARLAYRPGHEVGRELLMEMLWPGDDPRQMRNRLSVDLSWLRAELGEVGVPGKEILRGVDPLSLNPEYVHSDAATMEALSVQAQAIENPAARIPLLRQAVGLYKGPFLDGFDQHWITPVRASFVSLYLNLTHTLITALLESDDRDGAVEAARQCLQYAGMEEEAHALVIHALLHASRPCEAARQFADMLDRWQSEFGTAPGARIQQLGAEAQKRCTAAPALVHTPVLPQTFTRIIGRAQEIDALKSRLLDPETRLITLSGAGGNGKTRIAVEVARQLINAFFGAVWFVSLADVSNRQAVLSTIRSTLGLVQPTSKDPLQEIGERLAEQPCLLILDNFEHLADDEAPLIRSLLEMAPALKCLVTSRNVLRLSMETIFEVRPLPLPSEHSSHSKAFEQNPCVRLFLDRAKRVRPDFALGPTNRDAIAAICLRLDGIPLAIELAAAWARALTPVQMLAQIDRILVTRDRDIPDRHRSLNAAIVGSYERLSHESQRFFARLSVFRGGWTTDTAEAVCEEPFALMLLTDLQEASLILADNDGETIRFRLLEPLREFAAGCLKKLNEEATVRGRHTTHYLDMAAGAAEGLRSIDQQAWLARLDREIQNVRAALTEAASPVRLPAAASLQWYWISRGQLAEGRQWLAAADTRIDAVAAADQGRVMRVSGVLAMMGGDIEQARRDFNRSVALCRAGGDEYGIVAGLGNLANIASQQGDYAIARQEYEAGLLVARRLQSPHLTASILCNLGALCLSIDAKSDAMKYLLEALDLHAHFQNDLQRADVLHNLADLEIEFGQYDCALRTVASSLEIRLKLADKSRIPHALILFAVLAVCLSQYESAARFFGAAQQVLDELGLSLSPLEQEHCRSYLQQAQEQLGPAPFNTEWENGRSLRINEAITAALEAATSWQPTLPR